MRLLLLQKITLAFFFATKCDKHLTRLVALFLSYKPRHYAIFFLEKKTATTATTFFMVEESVIFKFCPCVKKWLY